MDLLQRELERKKAVLAKAQGDGTKKKRKYLKQSELRRLEEEEQKENEEEEEEKKEREREEATKRRKETCVHQPTIDESQDDPLHSGGVGTNTEKMTKKPKSTTNLSESKTSSTLTSSSDKITSLSPQQVTAQLRNFGLPICYFGERLEERIERLQSALQTQHQTLQGLSEMEEYRLGQGHGIRNPFLERTSRKEDSAKHENQLESNHVGTKQPKEEEQHDSGDDTENDPPKRIYKFLKGLLKEWESDLEARPASIANTVAGRNESKTLKQCKDYIRPLFKQLKRRRLEAGMQAHLTKIVEFAQQGEFVKAHDAYMDVAIGRAAWPIGVTMVGIHARSGRAKIESSNVAHVMNSELQRKYLTSLKRLLSYAQKKRPDVDPSKKVL